MGLEQIKEFVEKAEAKIKGDPNLMAEFKADPVKTVEKVLGVDLPDEQLKGVADMLKGKMEGGVAGIGDAAKGALGAAEGLLGGLFHKK